MRFAITGSTGFVGTAVRERLLEEQHEVVPVRRGRRDDATVDWSPQEGWFRPGAMAGVDGVVHVTGASIGAKRWTEARRRLLRASRIDASRTLVEHLATLEPRPRVLVSASAVGYYGHQRGDEVLDDGASQGEGFLAELVADWEREVRAAESLGMRTVMLRFAPIISRDSEIMRRLLPPFRMGVGGTLGSGGQWFSWVSRDDVVEAVRMALLDERLSGPINVVAPEPLTNKEFTKTLGRVLGRPTVLPLPGFALRTIFGRGRAEETLLASQRVVPARLQELGFTFRHPTMESVLRDALARA